MFMKLGVFYLMIQRPTTFLSSVPQIPYVLSQEWLGEETKITRVFKESTLAVQYIISTHILLFRTSLMDLITIQRSVKLGLAVCQGSVNICRVAFL